MCVVQKIRCKESHTKTNTTVPVPLPTLVLVEAVWAGRNVGLPYAAFAPRLPLFDILQLEGACIHQRCLKRKELLVFARTNVASAKQGHVTGAYVGAWVTGAYVGARVTGACQGNRGVMGHARCKIKKASV